MHCTLLILNLDGYKRLTYNVYSSHLTTMPLTDEEKMRIAENKRAAEELRKRKAEEKKLQDEWNCKKTDQALLELTKKNLSPFVKQ